MMLIGFSTTGTSVFNLMPVASAELLGKENVQSAMAINFVYQGVANVISTFIAGG